MNDALLEARRSVRLVNAIRVALGRAVMPREWIESMTDGNDREFTLWLTDELLRFPKDRE